MPSTAAHLQLGAAGEETAVRFLQQKGWRIAARNWRPQGASRGLELDIVAWDGDCLVFVEVKSRRAGAGRSATGRDGIPAYAAFTGKKRGRFVRAARQYLAAHDLWRKPCRFDLISVEFLDNGHKNLEYQDHVIELGNLVDRGHASWQPW